MMSGLDWTEELKKRTGIDFLTTRPMEIEKKSFEIIKGELGEEFVSRYPADALPVLCRVIHTTADFSYRDTLTITEGAIGLAKEAIHRGLPIITDTTMAASGMTRSAVSAEKAARLYPECIYAVGNAPTALMRLYELIEEKKIRPALIIGVPVGFVNVVEAKELILRTDVPAIVARGRKGGSNIAAAICNALLYEAGGR